MAPRRSARVAAAVEAQTSALAPLPLAVVHRVFLLLPAEERARAACVCRGWRAVLADPAVWTHVDLAGFLNRGYTRRFSTWYGLVLQAATERARGRLRRLDVGRMAVAYARRELLTLLAANAGSLRELHVHHWQNDCGIGEDALRAFVAAAPLLQVVDSNASVDWRNAVSIMRAEPPFTPMRLSLISVLFCEPNLTGHGGLERVQPFAAALADSALQATLSCAVIVGADTRQPAVMNALADAIVARRLRRLKFDRCTPPAAASLARLLTSGSLETLELSSLDVYGNPVLYDDADTALFADALRANTTLTSLTLSRAGASRHMAVAGPLLAALVAHPTLRELVLVDGYAAEPVALGAALAALVIADARCFETLVVHHLMGSDAGLTALVDALPHNRHLRKLDINCFDFTSDSFQRHRLLPAVRANTGLRELVGASHLFEPSAAVREAQELVKRRPPRT